MSSNSKPIIQSIIFDFGGVLGTDADTIFIELLMEKGIQRKKAIALWEQYWPSLKTGKIKVETFWIHMEKALRINRAVLKKEYASKIVVNKNMLHLCSCLRKKGFRLGILANEADDWMNIKRKKGKLRKIFHVIHASADITCAKPDPHSYAITLKSLKSQPRNTIFIDNLVRNLKVAKTLGMITILFTNQKLLEIKLKKLGII